MRPGIMRKPYPGDDSRLGVLAFASLLNDSRRGAKVSVNIHRNFRCVPAGMADAHFKHRLDSKFLGDGGGKLHQARVTLCQEALRYRACGLVFHIFEQRRLVPRAVRTAAASSHLWIEIRVLGIKRSFGKVEKHMLLNPQLEFRDPRHEMHAFPSLGSLDLRATSQHPFQGLSLFVFTKSGQFESMPQKHLALAKGSFGYLNQIAELDTLGNHVRLLRNLAGDNLEGRIVAPLLVDSFRI